MPNKFVRPELSRIEFHKNHPALFDNTPLPSFDARGFVNNLEDITLKVNSYQELSDRIVDGIGTFIWPLDWFSLVVYEPKSQTPVLVPNQNSRVFPLKDFELGKQNTILDFSVKNRKILYIPDCRFERRDYFYYLKVPEERTSSKPKETSAKTEKLNVEVFVKSYER